MIYGNMIADNLASQLSPMIPPTKSLIFTPPLILINSTTNIAITNYKKHCHLFSLQQSKHSSSQSSPVISNVFNNPLVSFSLSTFPFNEHISSPKFSIFKLNLINYSLPFDDRETKRINKLKNNPNFDYLSLNPMTQRIIAAFNNPSCPTCSHPSPDRNHIFSSCSAALSSLNQLDSDINDIIKSHSGRTLHIPKWFSTSNSHHFQPNTEIFNLIQQFPKYLGDLGYIPSSLSNIINFIFPKMKSDKKQTIIHEITKTIANSTWKRWCSHRTSRFSSLPQNLKGSNFRNLKSKWMNQRIKMAQKRFRNRDTIPVHTSTKLKNLKEICDKMKIKQTKHPPLPQPPPLPQNRIIITPSQIELTQHNISNNPSWINPNLISKLPNRIRFTIKKYFPLDNSFDPPPPKPFKQRLKDPSKKKSLQLQYVNTN